MKICIVSSCGGHLTEVRALKPAYEKYPHFYILNDKVLLPPNMLGKTFFVTHSERDLLFFMNLWEAFRVLWRERPQVILSTGAGPAVPFSLVGRYLFGCRIIFVETFTRVSSPSLTGRIMYHISHHFFYQRKRLKSYFPKGIYGGGLL